MEIIGNVEKDAQVRAVASGALPSGDAVIVNSDGTVSVVGITAGPSSTPVLEGVTVFREGSTDDITSAYDTNSNKLVVAYIESTSSGLGKAVVGTVSGTSITFGSPVSFNANTIGGNVKMTFDSSSNKVVIAYRGDSLYGTAVVGTVSGTSISFGTPVVFLSGRAEGIDTTFDSNSNKVVICFNDDGDNQNGKAIVGTVSGTSISFGTATEFETGYFAYPTITFDSNANKVVIAYYDFGGSAYAIVGTVSGTSISFGSKATIRSGSTNSFASCFDSSNNKIIITYSIDDGTGYGALVVGTVSGTSITLGTAVVFNSGTTYQKSLSYDSDVNKVVISFRNAANSQLMTYLFATISGTTATFSAATVSDLTDSRAISSVYDPDSSSVLVSFTNGSTVYGTTQVVKTTASVSNLTSENFLGFAAHTYADTQSALVNSTCTVDRNQTSLTAGQTYYVQSDGSLGTTAGDPSVVAGTAISSTEIIVKG